MPQELSPKHEVYKRFVFVASSVESEAIGFLSRRFAARRQEAARLAYLYAASIRDMIPTAWVWVGKETGADRARRLAKSFIIGATLQFHQFYTEALDKEFLAGFELRERDNPYPGVVSGYPRPSESEEIYLTKDDFEKLRLETTNDAGASSLIRQSILTAYQYALLRDEGLTVKFKDPNQKQGFGQTQIRIFESNI